MDRKSRLSKTNRSQKSGKLRSNDAGIQRNNGTSDEHDAPATHWTQQSNSASQSATDEETAAKLESLINSANAFIEMSLEQMERTVKSKSPTKRIHQQSTESLDDNSRTKKQKLLTKHDETSTKRRKRKAAVVDEIDQDTVTGNSESLRLNLFTGGELREYQLDGVRWLKAQYECGFNGILADEMGLGKTVQVIALICHLYESGSSGPFLIVAPLSTLSNWQAEFNRFAPLLNVVLYHGNTKKASVLQSEIKAAKKNAWNGKTVFPVVVTNPDMLMNHYHFIRSQNWCHLIIDEAQRIKNPNCRLLIYLKPLIKARLILTGTPVQNNITELWSLLNYLMPDIFVDLEFFQSMFRFDTLSSSANEPTVPESDDISHLRETQMLEKLHKLLEPFILRRLKRDVEIHLPRKKEIIVYTPMMPLQRKYYKAAVEKLLLEMFQTDKPHQEVVISSGTKGYALRSDSIRDDDRMKSNTREGAVLAKLRLTGIRRTYTVLQQLSMHPYIVEYPLYQETHDRIIDEELVQKSGKLLVLDRLLSVLLQHKHKILIFSQFTTMLDILMDYCKLRRYKFCRLDGRMSLEARDKDIAKFNSSDTQIFLISIRAGGLGLNLVSADTVVLFDNDWNPQIEIQAQDRCHRIGQTKPVNVYRLIARGTLDQKIHERALMKRRLEALVIHQKKFKRISRDYEPVPPKELQEMLLAIETNECWAPKEDAIDPRNIISDEDLETLLERGD